MIPLGQDLPANQKTLSLWCWVELKHLDLWHTEGAREPACPLAELTVLGQAACQKAVFTTIYLWNIVLQTLNGREYFNSISLHMHFMKIQRITTNFSSYKEGLWEGSHVLGPLGSMVVQVRYSCRKSLACKSFQVKWNYQMFSSSDYWTMSQISFLNTRLFCSYHSCLLLEI